VRALPTIYKDRDMIKLYKSLLLTTCALLLGSSLAFAGNPDRQGEAGAYELLMLPWARSAGLHAMNTSNVSGVEAMRINVAGLSRINSTEIVVANGQYLVPSGVAMNGLGLSQRVGENGALGVSLMALDFGDIPVTTVNNPEGTGGTFSPSFFNLGVGYSYTFDKKISVGALFRGISQSIADLNAFGFALDAGVQYVTGPRDNFKFGISLRNVGGRMDFGGEGLADIAVNEEDQQLRYDIQAATFELPSMLNIGVSYDFYFAESFRLTAMGNFRANSFSRDQLGGAVEFAFNEWFMLRAGYQYDMGITANAVDANAYSGLAGGISFDVPLKKGGDQKLGIDYAYRASDPFSGTHNFGLRVSL
jgi:hypothetical protein